MNNILLSELREKIEDSNAYCDIYEINTPALHVIMIPHYSIDNNATENKIMWQLPSGKIIQLKEQLRHISIEEISAILQFNDINTTIQYMSRATDAQIAAIIIQYEKQYLPKQQLRGNPVHTTTEWSIAPDMIFLTHDEALDALETAKIIYGDTAYIRPIALNPKSLLAQLISEISCKTHS